MFYIKNIKIAASRRRLSFLKIKALGNKLKDKFLFNTDLNNFVEYH